MRAALRNGVKKIRMIEMDKPTPLADEVLISVKSCGICGSDINRIKDPDPKWDSIVIGHEFSGEIVEVGANVTGWKVGMNAAVAPLKPCHTCKNCAQGNYSLCKSYSFIGSRVQGGMGEFVRVPARNLVAMEGLTYNQAAFIEPITVCLHPILRLPTLLGKTVAVTGAGTIGLLAVQIFKAMGCKEIIVSDVMGEKLELAKQMGATIVCNPMEESLESMCARLVPEGVDVIFESSGANPAKISAMNIAKGRGKILLVGTAHAPITMTGPEFEQISRKELEIIGSWMNYSAPYPGEEWETAAWMMAQGMIVVDPLQTHTFPIEQIQDAFDVIYDNKELWAKVMINFN